MSTAHPTLESDLKAARESAGISVKEIQQETRIPEDVIRRFEEGRLIGDPAFNPVYLKAFLTAYASAIGLAPSKVLSAYDAYSAGSYQGQLGNGTSNDQPAKADADVAEETNAEHESTAQHEEFDAPEVDTNEELADEDDQGADEVEWVPRQKPVTTAFDNVPPAPAEPKVTPLNEKPQMDKAWMLIGGIALLIVCTVLFILWMVFKPSGEQAGIAESDLQESTSSDTTEEAGTESEVESGLPLQLPIRISVVAGGDGLQGFRVTEAPDERRPYWVAFGDELVLESNEEVVLWGEGALGMDPAEVTLRFQGYEWRPRDGQILRVNPQTGQALLDSLHATGQTPSGN